MFSIALHVDTGLGHNVLWWGWGAKVIIYLETAIISPLSSSLIKIQQREERRAADNICDEEALSHSLVVYLLQR